MADPQDQDNIRASYEAEGLPVPEQLLEPPTVGRDFVLYWQAYSDLQHDRPESVMGGKVRRIPWATIAAYASHHGLNVDELKRYIWALDSELIGAAPNQEGQTEDEEPRP